jgi:hypothetical protein
MREKHGENDIGGRKKHMQNDLDEIGVDTQKC